MLVTSDQDLSDGAGARARLNILLGTTMHHWIQLAMIAAGVAALYVFFHTGQGENEFVAGDFIIQILAFIIAVLMLIGAALWFDISGILGF